MADSILAPDTNDETGEGPDREPTTGTRPNTPRWVKVFGIIALVLILMFVAMLFAGGDHGPSRHMPSGITEFGMQMLAWEIEPR